MNWIVRLLLVALLSFTAGSADAYADCGNCGDAGHADTEKGDHSHGEKAAECSCKSAKDGASYWCGHCGVGHHEGKKIKCEGCYKKATGESKESCSSCSKKKAPDAAEKSGECEG